LCIVSSSFSYDLSIILFVLCRSCYFFPILIFSYIFVIHFFAFDIINMMYYYFLNLILISSYILLVLNSFIYSLAIIMHIISFSDYCCVSFQLWKRTQENFERNQWHFIIYNNIHWRIVSYWINVKDGCIGHNNFYRSIDTSIYKINIILRQIVGV